MGNMCGACLKGESEPIMVQPDMVIYGCHFEST